MSEVIRITPEVAIPVAELEFRASRASGPGGQGVNTTDSRVELRFDLAGSPSLTPEQKERALRRLGPRLDRNGVLRVVALATPTTRRPTRPTQAATARRVEDKRRRSATKRLRGRPPLPDD